MTLPSEPVILLHNGTTRNTSFENHGMTTSFTKKSVFF